MAHELSFQNGLAEFAYLESDGLAWHGFGQAVGSNEPLSTWLNASNMGNWTIEAKPLLAAIDGTMHLIPNQRSLHRSDNHQHLAIVSERYNLVQPREVVEFFDDIIRDMGFELATCGVLFGGKRFWAMANIGESVNILGTDRVDGKLLFSTSCDGTLASTIQYTTVRVVCNNTLRMAVGNMADSVRVTHGQKFDADEAKQILGIGKHRLDDFKKIAEACASFQLTSEKALDFFYKALSLNTEDESIDHTRKQSVKALMALFNGQAKGSEVAPQSLWQALNCVTEYVDHVRPTTTNDHRRDSALFGTWAKVKDRAFEEALLLAA